MVILYITAILLLSFTDSASTWYLIKFGLGEEINPFVDTSSFGSILVSPPSLILLPLYIGFVIFCEQSYARTSRLIKNRFLLFLFCLPYYYLVTLTFVTVNNILIAFRFRGPVTWLIEFFDMGDWFGLYAAMTLIAFIVLPITEIFIKKRYSPIPG